MGRPPCCEKVGVKKGPWTPEEDIMLVSFVQEHGPGNWRTVPTKTGLRRCSKSCRLRWTNYLRPGIKRGNFTDQEEKMIIQLQALLGNKWAAIASYLPERTDNDIKNYWNTHLKKKLKRLQESPGHEPYHSSYSSHSPSKGQWERTLQADINMAKQALHNALSLENPIPVYVKQESQVSSCSTYASSTENIARLLKGWTKTSSTINSENSKTSSNNVGTTTDSSSFESLFGIESFESSSSDQLSHTAGSPEASKNVGGEIKKELEMIDDHEQQVPLSVMLENWLLDENTFDDENAANLFLKG